MKETHAKFQNDRYKTVRGVQGFLSEIYLRGRMSLLTYNLGDIWGNFRG